MSRSRLSLGPYSMNTRNSLYFWFCLLGILGSAVAVTAQPTITQQPASVSVASGQPAILSVAATGTGTVSYQWRRLGQPIAGAIGNTLTLPVAKLVDASFYDVEVKDGQGRTLSQSAQLGITAPVATEIYRMDTTFAPYFSQTGRSPFSWVQSAAVASDGSVVIGGGFWAFMGQPRECLARVNAAMELDPSFHPSVNACVRNVRIQPDGKILISGEFNQVDGAPRNGLARLNQDGSLDTSFDPGPALAGADFVLAFALQSDGKILVGCNSPTWIQAGRAGLVRMLPTGQPDPGFAPPSRASVVSQVVLAPEGKIYVGGGFAAGDPATETNVMRLNFDGSLDRTFASPILTSTQGATALALQSDGKIIVASGYMQPVRYDSRGAVDTAFDASHGGVVRALYLQPDGKIIAGYGSQYGTLGDPESLVRWNSDGSRDTSFAAPNPDGSVLGLGPHPDGGVVVCGEFTHIGTTAAAGVGRLSAPGALLGAPLGSHGYPGTVDYVIPLPGGRWLAGGAFTHVGVIPRAGLAVLDADGSVDASFDCGAGLGTLGGRRGTISSMVRDGLGRIVIAGDFTLYSGHPCRNLVRLLSDGTWDSQFLPDWGLENCTLKIDPRGRLYVTARTTIYRLSDSGSIEPEFQAASALKSAPYGFAFQPDQKIAYGSGAYGENSIGMGRLNADGSADGTFNSGSGFSWGRVFMVSVQPDGKILVGGDFTSFNGRESRGLVRLLPSGAVDRSFYRWSLRTANIMHTLPLSDGSMLVSGNLDDDVMTPVPDRRITSLWHLGSDWQLISLAAYDANGSSEVFALDDGRLMLAGAAAKRGSVHANGLVLLKPESVSPVPVIVTSPVNTVVRTGDTATLMVKAGGEGTFSYGWRRNGGWLVGATQPTLTISDAQESAGGSYDVVVWSEFGAVLSQAAILVVHNEAQTDFGGWASANFTASELGDSSISGFPADPDGVGVSNLMRYAFKLPARGQLIGNPVQIIARTVTSGEQRLVLTFPRKTYAPGLRYVVEGASSLPGPWSVVDSFAPGFPESVEVIDSVAVSSATSRFLRVRVEQAP